MAKTKILIEDCSLNSHEFDKDDVIEYAKQIGIDVENEKHLMWIAEEGLTASVPEPWLILCDEKGRVYFTNIETHEKSWLHPLDKEYSALVVTERNKGLSSSLSDCGRESRLSSLSDAPPLSPGGQTSSSSLKHGKANITHSEKKLELGTFENRRGTKLAPVRLNILKAPSAPATPKLSSGMSFMPKGSSLSRNIRRASDDQDHRENQMSGIRTLITLPQDDFNESLNSDDGSKYSYEETDDEMEKSYDNMNPSDIGSQFSPLHSADDSPEALDINSLVQLGQKLPPRLESGKMTSHLQSLKEDRSPSLNLRKTGQLSSLKPLQQAPKKKAAPKNAKKSKKTAAVNSSYDFGKTEEDLNYSISAYNEEQRLKFQSVQQDWAAMQEELERDEKAKYEQLVNDSEKRLAEKESLIRKDIDEKLLKLREELEKNTQEEENLDKLKLAEIRKSRERKYIGQEEEHKKELEAMNEGLKVELRNIEQKNVQEVSDKKKDLEEEMKKTIEDIKTSQQLDIKRVEEAHAKEMELLEKAHKDKIANLKDVYSEEDKDDKKMKNEIITEETNELKIEKEKLEQLLKSEREKYEQVSAELSNLKIEIASEREVLLKLQEKTTTAQTYYEEIQDEVDKTENDLDLLRSEKSAIISELNILKQNVNNEKSIHQKEKNQEKSGKKEFADKVINTESNTTMCQNTQTYIELKHVSCEIKELEVSKIEKSCQTIHNSKPVTYDVSCQIDFSHDGAVKKMNDIQRTRYSDTSSNNVGAVRNEYPYSTNSFDDAAKKESENFEALVNKALQSAITNINDKMENRFKTIEEQLGSLHKTFDSSNKVPPDLDVFSATSNNLTTDVKAISNALGCNHIRNNALTCDPKVMKDSLASILNCGCKVEEPGPCTVLQDVKNSVYRLNDILSASFVPSFGKNVIPSFNYSRTNYSTSLESFYAQFRQLQEKQRITELKHKLQREKGEPNSSFDTGNSENYFKDFARRESSKLPQIMNAGSFAVNVSEDPIIRARNLVLREQAQSWKPQQRQFINSSGTQGFVPLERNYNLSISDNISQSPSSRVSSGLSEISPAGQFPFLRFEPDPESDYNEWMSRLKTLQDKIRSHKFL